MSISFSCSQCGAQVEVGDEFAGHAGQCPRCASVIAIPSKHKPAVPDPAQERPRSDPKSKAQTASGEIAGATPATAAVRTAPKPFGPIWPWLVGGVATLIFIGLTVSSVSVLAFWRKPVTAPKVDQPIQAKPVGKAEPRVTVGRLEGPRAILQNGAFQIQTHLTNNDPIDHDDPNGRCRCKRFEVQLRANVEYIVELDSQDFMGFVRIETPNRQILVENQDQRLKNVWVSYRPFNPDLVIVYATCFDPALGDFTLTIRERTVPKPWLP